MLLLVLGVVVSTLLLSTAPVGAGSATGITAQPTARSDTSLRSLLRDVVAAGVPGAVVRVQQGGSVTSRAAGVSDVATGAPLRPAARFRAGSITKSFVATVVLQLVEEEKLSLDDTVEQRLPGLLWAGDLITVRQVLQHTSGLADYTADPGVLTGVAQNRVFKPRELVKIAETMPATTAPGSGFGYSNTNYIVAGLLVEAVTGHRLGHELRRRIIGPLHLTGTSFPVSSKRIPDYHAHGYVPTALAATTGEQLTDVTALNPSAAWAAGALVSTTTDLSRFYRALMSGRLLGPDMLRQMKDTVAQDPTEPATFRYGLGIERVQDPCGANLGTHRRHLRLSEPGVLESTDPTHRRVIEHHVPSTRNRSAPPRDPHHRGALRTPPQAIRWPAVAHGADHRTAPGAARPTPYHHGPVGDDHDQRHHPRRPLVQLGGSASGRLDASMTPHEATPAVLVTGATGNVGSQIVERLLVAEFPVRAAASSVEAVRSRFGDRVEAVALDFTDPATWREAYSGVRQIFLMRPPHLGQPKTQMLPSLEAARATGVGQVVLLSLQGAEHNKVVPHHALEVWLRESGMSWTFVRAAFFMQNLTTTHLTDVRDRDTIVVPAGEGATAFVDVHDVAAVATAALLNPAEHRNTAWREIVKTCGLACHATC